MTTDQNLIAFVVIGSFLIAAVSIYFLARDRANLLKAVPPELFDLVLSLMDKAAKETPTPIDDELLAVIRKEIQDAIAK